jgi:Alkylmercury lyase
MPSSMTAEDIRVLVYRWFAESGRAPSVAALSTQCGIGGSEVRDHLAELHRQRHLVLGADGSIVMAHPFSAVPLGFAVMGASTLWWGGCAWDSFALPHLLTEEADVLVSTRCPGCGAPHAWVVDSRFPPAGQQVAHFLVPARHMWDDVLHTCGNQRLFCDRSCIDGWLERTGNRRGYVLDLSTLWRLAEHWYDGRLDHGYQRREPAAAADYFREVGLEGTFWSL